MKLEELATGIQEFRAQELQKVADGPLARMEESRHYRGKGLLPKSRIMVPINNNLKLAYDFTIQPQKEIKKLAKGTKRDDFGSVWQFARLFDYVLQTEIAEEIQGKDVNLNCLRQSQDIMKDL